MAVKRNTSIEGNRHQIIVRSSPLSSPTRSAPLSPQLTSPHTGQADRPKRRKRPFGVRDSPPVAPKRHFHREVNGNDNGNNARHNAANDIRSMTTQTKREQQQQQDQKERRLGVRFHHRVKTRKILSHRDMTSEEHLNCWYLPREYRKIERRNERTIRRIEELSETRNGHLKMLDPRKHAVLNSNSSSSSNNNNGVGDDDDLYCGRGLESGLSAEYFTFEARKAASYRAVFREQDRYGSSESTIAKAYSRVSKQSRFRARTRALLDRDEVADDDEREPAERYNDYVHGVDCDDGDDDDDDDSSPSVGSMRLRKPFAVVRSWVVRAAAPKHHHHQQQQQHSRHERKLR